MQFSLELYICRGRVENQLPRAPRCQFKRRVTAHSIARSLNSIRLLFLCKLNHTTRLSSLFQPKSAAWVSNLTT